MTKQPSPRLRLALTIVQSVLLVLTITAVCLAVILAISYLSVEDPSADSTTSEQIGIGLSRAFSAAFFVFAAITTAILTIPGEIIAILLTKKTVGWGKFFGIFGIVSYSVLVLICGVFWIFVIYAKRPPPTSRAEAAFLYIKAF